MNLKIFIKNDGSDMIKSYFFINCFFIINLMPFIPSGSFFNNWMSIMFYFPLGFWLYIHSQIEQKKLNN